MRFLLAFIFLISNTTWGQTVNKGLQFDYAIGVDSYTNFIINPSAAKNTGSTLTSSASLTRDTSAGNKIDGVSSWLLYTSALNGYALWSLKDIYDNATSGNCEFKGIYKGDGTLYSAQIQSSGGGVLNQVQLQNVSVWTPFSVTYPCDTASNRLIVIKQTTAGTSPAINVGKLYYGVATNLGTGSLQPQYVGSLKYAATTNCEWSTTSTSYANFTADTDCATPIVTGGISAPATKIPGFVINNVQPGTYLFVARGVFRELGGNGTNHGFRFNDGTTSSVVNPIYVGAASAQLGSINGEITYTGAQSNVTVQVQGVKQGTDTTYITATSSNWDLEFSVYYYPPANIQTIVTPNQWNYDWTAYTPTFTGFGTVSPASNQCYHKREGPNLYLRCYFTSGTATSTEARMSLPTGLTSASNLFTVTSVGDMAENFNGNAAVKILIEPSVSYITFGYQQSGTSGLTKALGSTLFTSGQGGSFTTGPIPIQGWTENQSAPILLGSVTSNASVADLNIRSRITCGNSGSAVVKQNAGISVANGASDGLCTVTITGMSDEAQCSCSVIGAATTSATHCIQTSVASGTIALQRVRAGAAENGDVIFNCGGPR